MLLLLSARLDDVSGASWSASLEVGELTILNLSLRGNLYFEMGLGESKSKSKKDVGQKMIANTNLYHWLEKNYPDRKV